MNFGTSEALAMEVFADSLENLTIVVTEEKAVVLRHERANKKEDWKV